eukprot:TRINITY_DN60160_c0_g1_i1.p1 TRINITY_DN60160_c0_g1~~TRINITY_DN60160_c0_g1_i1.p1  ORF type:complete len:265 (-),score=66.91 TRINITY_DN60160_c0_g1_i1:105-899(-)
MPATAPQCPVCLDESYQCDGPYQPTVLTNCGHLFHASCIQEWIKHQRKCPVCKKPATVSTLLTLYWEDEAEPEVVEVEDVPVDVGTALDRERDSRKRLEQQLQRGDELDRECRYLQEQVNQNKASLEVQQANDRLQEQAAAALAEVAAIREEMAAQAEVHRRIKSDSEAQGRNTRVMQLNLDKAQMETERIRKQLKEVKDEYTKMQTMVGSLGFIKDILETDNDDALAYQQRHHTPEPVSYTHLRAHETPEHLVCRLLLEKKKN